LKFKIDENLRAKYSSILRGVSFEADTVSDEKLSGASDSVLSDRCRAEDRVLMTPDLDFASVQAYPPVSHPGIAVFRPKSQDKPRLVALLKRLVPVLLQLSPSISFGLSSRTASGIAKNYTPRSGTSILTILASHGSTNLH
jgi:predicted nuclease of predicted toxin-antitoxin system